MTEIGDLLRDWLEKECSKEESSQDILLAKTNGFLDDFYSSLEGNANEILFSDALENTRFIKRNIRRWKEGFVALDTLVSVCREAGKEFQEEFLQFDEYSTDVHLGVLMRIHARGIRISSEISTLMKAGYADGALSRWRSLYELGLAALAISRIGREASIDYFLSGKVKALEGMKEHRKCAERMGNSTFSENEISTLAAEIEGLLQQHDRVLEDYNGDFGWLRKHINSGKRNKVEEFLELSHWSHDFKWASQDVHAGYREMRSLLAMSEAQQDILLVGPSNSGMTDPAHRTAISLSWITIAFISCYVDRENCPLDSFGRAVWVGIITRLCAKVGISFLSADTVVERARV